MIDNNTINYKVVHNHENLNNYLDLIISRAYLVYEDDLDRIYKEKEKEGDNHE